MRPCLPLVVLAACSSSKDSAELPVGRETDSNGTEHTDAVETDDTRLDTDTLDTDTLDTDTLDTDTPDTDPPIATGGTGADSDPLPGTTGTTGHTGGATGSAGAGTGGTGRDATGTTADTGPPDTGIVPSVIAATCIESPDNVLRYHCGVDVDPPQGVEISFQPDGQGGPVRTVASPAPAAHHDLTLIFMEAQTPYAYEARATLDPAAVDTGGWVTGTLPPGARVSFTVQGSSTAPMVMLNSPCDGAHAVIADSRGFVLWYHTFEAPDSFPLINVFTEDDSVMFIYRDFDNLPPRSRLVEVDLYGNELLRVSEGAEVPRSMHHDAFRKDGLTYVIFQEIVNHQGADHFLDGFYVLDSDGTLVDTWRLYDHFQPPYDNPGQAIDDTSHANGLSVDDAGDIWISFRNLSAFAKVARRGPGFGEILWRMAGDPLDPDFGNDFALYDPILGDPTFQEQHNPHPVGNGRMAMFDNRISQVELSRLLTWVLDESGMTATVDGVYVVDRHCSFQGGALHTAAGNPIATCAPFHEAWEFEVGQPFGTPPIWEVRAVCNGPGSNYVPRFVPLDL